MKKSTKRLSILVAFLLVSSLCKAGEHRWTNAGLSGANVRDLAVHPGDPSVVFLATSGAGIFRSVDRGDTWSAVNSGIEDPLITSLAIDPASPNVIYAATGGGRLMKTVNGGQSWVETHRFPGKVLTVVIDRKNHQLYVGTGNSVFFSKDGGTTWTRGAGLAPTAIWSLGINPMKSSEVFAGTDQGFYRSSDSGAKWTRVAAVAATILAIEFDPNDPKRIYLGARDEFVSSSNGGETWQTYLHNSGSWETMDLIADPRVTGTVHATSVRGIYRTENGGADWTLLPGLSGTVITAIAEDRTSGAMFAGGITNVYRSTDRGATWTTRSRGLTSPSVLEVAMASTDPSLIYASTADGIYKTSDGGTSWELSHAVASSYSIAIDPITPTNAFAGSAQGAFKTTDEGKTWTGIQPSGDIKAYISEFVIDPTSPTTVYAALFDSGIAKSMDSGDTWSFINFGLPPAYYGLSTYSLAVDPSTPSTLFAGTMGIARSTDGGASWTRTSAGLEYPNGANWYSTPDVIAVDPNDSSLVYGAGWEGFYRSVDGGDHWTFLRRKNVDGSVRDLVIDPRNPSTIYIGTQDRGILQSSDRGETWISFNEGLESETINSIAIDASGKFLVAATNEGLFSFQFHSDLPAELQSVRLADDATRLPALIDQIRNSERSGADSTEDSPAFVIPAAGFVHGMGGTSFRSDVTLISRSASSQQVIVAWLSAGTDGTSAPSFRMTLPAGRGTHATTVTVNDFVDKLGFSGLGALLVIAVDVEGILDEDASIDAFARIWTAGKNQQGSVSESLPAIPVQSSTVQSDRLAIGLRHEAGFRLNLGIVNLDSQPQTFAFDLIGERERTTEQVTVAPLSILQVPVQQGDHGAVAARFRPATTNFLWAGYGSSVDNTSGDAWASIAK